MDSMVYIDIFEIMVLMGKQAASKVKIVSTACTNNTNIDHEQATILPPLRNAP